MWDNAQSICNDPIFQIRSHSQILGDKTFTYIWGDTIQPVTDPETTGVAFSVLGEDEINDGINALWIRFYLQVQGHVLNSILVAYIVVICPQIPCVPMGKGTG